MAIETTKYEAADLRRMHVYLSQHLQTVAEAMEFVESSGKPLWVFKHRTQLQAMQKLGAFCDELRSAVNEARVGTPYGPNTLKPRARVQPYSSSGHDPSEADAAAKGEELDRDIRRAVKRAAAKKAANGGAAGGRKKKSGG